MFDAEKEMSELKTLKKNTRKKRYYSSQLDKYTDELIALKKSGARYADLRRWLRTRRVYVEWSTVQRWFSRHG